MFGFHPISTVVNYLMSKPVIKEFVEKIEHKIDYYQREDRVNRCVEEKLGIRNISTLFVTPGAFHSAKMKCEEEIK